MPHQAKLYEILAAYQRNRRQHFTDRDTLEQWQRRMLLRLYKEILPQSPYYREYLGTPLDSWPPVSAPDLVPSQEHSDFPSKYLGFTMSHRQHDTSVTT